MDFVTFLPVVSLRSLALAALAALALCRVKSPATRHAVWTLVTAGMLAIAVAGAALPSIPVRVVARAPRPAQPPTQMAALHLPSSRPAPPRPFPWQSIYTAVALAFTARLAYAYHLTRKLVRASTLVEPGIYESDCISVPLTVGWLRPKILLPNGWNLWEPEKLQAVLVHERNHIRRADWAVALLAGVNRCVFWFHPLAWWLDAHLKFLAEQACDDASLPHVASRECYAQVLVEMAAAIRPGEGRVAWEAMAITKGAEVRMRVERILDDSRQIFPAMTRARWFTMGAAAIPLIYLTAVARPARVRAQDPQPAVAVQPTNQELDAARAKLANLESQVVTFKSANIGRLPEQFQVNVSQLSNSQTALGNANEALARFQQEKLMLETQLQNLNNQRNYYASDNNRARRVRSVETRLHDLELQLAAARETYTPEHPNIKRLKDSIVDMQQELQMEHQPNPQNEKTLLDLDGNIALLKVQIQNLNLSMDEKLKQVQHLNRTIAEYQQRIENSPALEMRYAELQRDLDTARQHVLDLSQRSAPESKVQLSLTIGPNGVPRDIRVTRSLGPASDQKAIEWVKAMKFPAPRNGEAAPATIVIEVPVRLQ